MPFVRFRPWFVLMLLLFTLRAQAAGFQSVWETAERDESTIGFSQLFSGRADSLPSTSFLFYDGHAYRTFRAGAFAGSAAALLGTGLLAFSLRNQNSCDLGCAVAFTVVPIFSWAIGFTAGTTYGYFAYKKHRGRLIHTRDKYKRFYRYGLKVGASFSSYDATVPVALTVRADEGRSYLPNTFAVTYSGGTTWDYDETNNSSGGGSYDQIDYYRLGFEALQTDYHKVVSLMYGFEFGLAMIDTRPDGGGAISSRRFAGFLNFALGTHVNVFHWADFQALYRLEPWNGLNGRINRRNVPVSINHLVTIALSVFIR